MTNSNIQITFTNGQFIKPAVTSNGNGLLDFNTHAKPLPCYVRKGGPKSRIYCEVFKHVPHELHCGRSRTGRWWSWVDKPLPVV